MLVNFMFKPLASDESSAGDLERLPYGQACWADRRVQHKYDIQPQANPAEA
jgi:hypothetical protein